MIECFGWTEAEFKTKMAGSAIYRIGYEQWLRNITVGLGNAPTSHEVIEALKSQLNHESEVVKEHVDWALAQHVANKE